MDRLPNGSFVAPLGLIFSAKSHVAVLMAEGLLYVGSRHGLRLNKSLGVWLIPPFSVCHSPFISQAAMTSQPHWQASKPTDVLPPLRHAHSPHWHTTTPSLKWHPHPPPLSTDKPPSTGMPSPYGLPTGTHQLTRHPLLPTPQNFFRPSPRLHLPTCVCLKLGVTNFLTDLRETACVLNYGSLDRAITCTVLSCTTPLHKCGFFGSKWIEHDQTTIL